MLFECFDPGWAHDGLACILSRGDQTANTLSGLAIDTRIIVDELERHPALVRLTTSYTVAIVIYRANCREIRVSDVVLD